MVADLQGTIATTITLPGSTSAGGVPITASMPTALQESDEYGNLLPTTPGAPTPAALGTGPVTYAWHRQSERARTTVGLVLMGARVYITATGKFTSRDPVLGGNSTAYAHPQDPINHTDLDGQKLNKKAKKFFKGAKKWWNNGGRGKVIGGVRLALGVVALFSCTLCAVAAGVGYAWSAYDVASNVKKGRYRAAASAATGFIPVGASRGLGGVAKYYGKKAAKGAERKSRRMYYGNERRMRTWERRSHRTGIILDGGILAYDSYQYRQNNWRRR